MSHQTAESLVPIDSEASTFIFPCSFAQRRLWLIDQIQPGSGAYNIPCAVRLKGRLDIDALYRSLNEIVRRHEVLRTSFRTIDGEPCQHIHKFSDFKIISLDLTNIEESQRGRRVCEIVDEEARRGFDLATGPLIRMKLIKLDADEHVLVLVMHHIVSDGWSIEVIVKEISQLYVAFAAGERSPLPELAIQYADYAVWQRDWFQGEIAAIQLQYWKNQFDGAPELLELPTDRARPAAASYSGASENIRLSGELARKLNHMSKREGVTLFMSLLAGFQLLLARYSGNREIAVGTPVAGRDEVELEDLIGLFLNTLVIKVDVSGDLTVKELLARVRQAALEAYAHQNLPFEKLVEVIHPERTLSHQPLFQVWFVLQNVPAEKLDVTGLSIEMFPIGDSFTKFDLMLSMSEGPDGLSGSLLYSADLFEPVRIQRMLSHLTRVLEGMAENEQSRVMELPLLSLQERQEVIVELNQTAVDYSRDRCVRQLFEQQVELTPEAVAAVYEGTYLTYDGLSRRANQLAHYLRKFGVDAEVKVGLCVERSLEMLVGLLGVMKAGGAYLPLDPSYPPERLAFMLEDAGAGVALTERRLKECLQSFTGRLLCLDEEWERVEQESEHEVISEVGAENLAYVIYTSGSTGRPKGVMLRHQSLTNYLLWAVGHYPLDVGCGAPVHSSLSFDLTITSLLTPLLVGSSVHLLPKDNEIESLAAVLSRRHGYSLVKLTPAHLRVLAELLKGVDLNGAAHAFVIGGENLSVQTVGWWRERAVKTRLFNEYGPTESVVGCSVYEVGSPLESEAERDSVPIGRPIANTRLYLLDNRQEILPKGVVGELCIGGDGLARGYLNHPDLTAERFVPSPYAGEKGGRMYRTGDLARYQEDGNLEFLGRVDDQVKIRGYRIELGEIEAALNQHASVEQVVVLAREDEPGERRLVAYLVAHGEVGSPELRAYLQEKLPEHMVPAVFVEMERMPLTANGKINRRALPRPELSAVRAGHVAARTAAEEILCEIWSEALGVERVGIHDNFFELGGDSILSIQVIAKARLAGLQLTPRQFFERQTIAELAEIAGLGNAVEGEQGDLSGEVPLTPIQRAFFAWGLAKPEHYNQAALVELKPEVDSWSLEQAVLGLIRQHDVLRLRYERKDGDWVQGYTVGVAEEVYRRVNFSAPGIEERVKSMEKDAAAQQASLRLSAGIMMRAVEYDLGGAGRRLLLIVHHLAVDGVSWRILLDDLQRGYEQLQRGGALELGAKTTSYRKWAERLAQYSRSEELREEVGYWERQQRRATEGVEKEEGEDESHYAAARRESRWLDEEQTKELLQEVPGVYHTQINDVLLAVLWEANRRWKGERSLVVELEGHGREEIFADVDLSRTVGWFTTIYPVKLEAESEEIGEALKEIKEQLRSIPKRGIGYGALRYLSQDEEVVRKLSGGARAEMRFNYLGQFDQVFKAEGLFRPARESSGPSQAAENRMIGALDVSGMVAGGRLRMEWVYSEKEHPRERIVELANHYMEVLEELMAHCRSEGAGGYTPSDFPLARLDQATLERVIRERDQAQDIYPLSPMQQGLLFHSLYEPGRGTYYEEMSCRIEGELKVEAFKRAWRSVVDRHAILRTSFVWEGLREPLQVVESGLKPVFREEDWRGCGRAEQSRKLEELLREEREQGFDLRKAPLLKFGLARVEEAAYYFIWGNHHILFDGWCRGLIIGEVFRFYEGYSRSQEVEMKRVRPYRDYIAWLGERDLGAAERFWREELRGIEGPTELGIERRVGSEEGESEQKQVRMSEETSRRLEEMGRKWQVTLNTVVEGAWAVLMSRYSGQQEVMFGATVSGRGGGLKGIEGMVGLFINTLPVRVEIRGEERVKDLMRRLHERQSKALEYEYSPLMEVQGWSEAPRGTPLFETIYVFQNYPLDAGLIEHADVDLRISEVTESSTNNYGITVRVVPGKELFLNVVYDSGRYEGDDIERLLKRLERVLEGMAEGEKSRVMELSLMSEEERQQVIGAWNATEAAYPHDECIHELFEQQVGLIPDAAAVTHEGKELTYRELNWRANQLGHYLRKLGVGAEMRVGICVERGLEMVVGLLGILKAGGAYVPLDPGYPQERLQYMEEDAGLAVLLTENKFDGLFSTSRALRICLDDKWAEIGGESEADLGVEMDAQNLAYVIYTSGSTGRPKGVAIAHHSASVLMHWAKETFSEDELSGVLASTSICFDLSVFEIFVPLSWGGKVIVTGNALELSEIKSGGVRLVNTVPSAMRELVRMKGVPGSVRTINLAGEALQESLVEQLYELKHVERVINLYGPSEDTTYSTYANLPGEGGGVTIGRPVANTQAYVLDEGMGAAPVGVKGELWLGGAGLARGYLNRPELSAERFVPSPFSESGGERLYRTGDEVRWTRGGDLEFIGRLDHQVKIRGYRIELGEIETRLREHPGVREAVVVAREDGTGDKRLVGYYAANWPVTGQQMKAYLQARLPDYMVPRAFVQLEEMPLTPNGKLDRRALPKPEVNGGGGQYVGARTTVEAILCGIWAQVLKIGRVSIHDNFFSLGADSLRVMEAVSLAKDAGLQLTARQFFESQTVIELAQLSQVGRESDSELGEALLVPARLTGSKSPLFFVHAAGGGVDFLWPIAYHLGPDQPFYGFRFKGLGCAEIYKPELEEVASEYLDLMKSVQPKGPYLIGGFSLGVFIAFEMARQLQDRGESVSLLALIDSGPSGADSLRDMEARFPIDLAKQFGVDVSLEEIATIEPDLRLDYVLTKIKSVTSEQDYSRIARIAPAWYGHLWSVERYLSKVLADPQSYRYMGKISLFRTPGDADTSMGWSLMSSQDVDINILAGTHGTLLEEPHVGSMARLLTRAILKSEQTRLEAISSSADSGRSLAQ